MVGVLQLLQMALVNVISLALKIRPEVSADVWAFVPLQLEPSQPFINRGCRFLGVPCLIGIFNTEDKGAAVMSGEEPVKERRARPADVQVTRGGGCEPNADRGTHFSVILSESEGPRKCCLTVASPL